MNFSGPTDRWRQGVRSIPLLLVLGCALLPAAVTAWPYVDCSGTNPAFALTTVTAYFDPVDTTIDLSLLGNFSNLYQYPAEETSQCRSPILSLNHQLYATMSDATSLLVGKKSKEEQGYSMGLKWGKSVQLALCIYSVIKKVNGHMREIGMGRQHRYPRNAAPYSPAGLLSNTKATMWFSYPYKFCFLPC